MKKKVKAKVTKRAPKTSSPETEMPDLVAVMTKMAERLNSLEQKMDLVVSQTANRSMGRPQEQRHAQPNVQHNAPRPQHSQPMHNQQRSNHGSSHQTSNQNQISNQSQTNNQGRGRDGRPLFKAVCADCSKDCEIPFKPSAERPVYCKECFSKRKAAGKPQRTVEEPNFNRADAQPSYQPQQRQVRVIPNGVGKVTISELVPAAAKKKTAAPAKKSKK